MNPSILLSPPDVSGCDTSFSGPRSPYRRDPAHSRAISIRRESGQRARHRRHFQVRRRFRPAQRGQIQIGFFIDDLLFVRGLA